MHRRILRAKSTKPNIEVLHYEDNLVLFRFTKAASVNRLYRNRKGQIKPYAVNNKVYLEILSYHNEIIDKKFLQCKNYQTTYILIHGDNRKRDLSNHIKIFEDIVHRLFIREDDSKVKMLTVMSYYAPVKDKYMLVLWQCLDEGFHHNVDEIVDRIKVYLK